MAIDLTVHLTDSEQQFIVDLAAVIAPGMSGAELVAWATTEAKRGLRHSVVNQYIDNGYAQEVATREQRRNAMETMFPEVQ